MSTFDNILGLLAIAIFIPGCIYFLYLLNKLVNMIIKKIELDKFDKSDVCCTKDEKICKCGHHTKDHSYNPDDLTTNLECDKCDCKNFVLCVTDDGGSK